MPEEDTGKEAEEEEEEEKSDDKVEGDSGVLPAPVRSDSVVLVTGLELDRGLELGPKPEPEGCEEKLGGKLRDDDVDSLSVMVMESDEEERGAVPDAMRVGDSKVPERIDV
eukprot:TRINITY_DN20729_c0_g1::TRINITY_DN20729_c0_g1_i1::g.9092::m.9092 TRINITY_DN20729_c0_g1::TRINITY_DN20729_c0_g1_i1::g.9092  ORF type:complete len:111 (+),score=27.30,DUF4622/PF15415.1/0.19 TRINITY_DN20729_c0_g1_i1:149-481(+)